MEANGHPPHATDAPPYQSNPVSPPRGIEDSQVKLSFRSNVTRDVVMGSRVFGSPVVDLWIAGLREFLPSLQSGVKPPHSERTRGSVIGPRNQEPRTKNQEPRTRNQEPGTRNQEPETRNQEPTNIYCLRLSRLCACEKSCPIPLP